MEFRICKQTIFRLMLEGLVICMLFGLIGCGRNKNKSVEEIAKTYLENTYKTEFVVEELTKKDAGPFKTKEYSGFAYEKENPENRFKVWVDKDSTEVVDAYYSVSVLPKATEWIKNEASDIWENVEVGLVLDVIRPDTEAFYKADEYVPFFENESVECEVYLFLESRDYLTIERYEKFDGVINELLNGYVQIFIIDKSTFKSKDIVDFYGKNPDICIRIGAPTSVIKEKLP